MCYAETAQRWEIRQTVDFSRASIGKLGIFSESAVVVLAVIVALVAFFTHSGFVDRSRKDDVDSFRARNEAPEGAGAIQVWGADSAPAKLDTWYRQIRPALHQASYYTVPTYYLDTDLNIVDFNVAFEVLFRRDAGIVRGAHVNALIELMENASESFAHARKFSDKVRQEGVFPFVDLEPLIYHAGKYGRAELTKIASQLHDDDGKLTGWAVALMPRALDWGAFEDDLLESLYLDKLWSVYSGVYDRLLVDFPPYVRLVEDVCAVVQGRGRRVADLGAGTGMGSLFLAKNGHEVTAGRLRDDG